MSDIKIANAPCSWGALEFELEGKALGYQQVLDEIAETGYIGTELGDWGFMPIQPKNLNKALNKRNLELLGAFVPVALAYKESHKAGVAQALKTAELMSDAGFPNAFIVLADENGSEDARTKNSGRITSEMGLSTEQWNTFANGAMEIASAVKLKYNMQTVFHHHCGGYVETPHEIDKLMELTDPSLLGLCLDTGHYSFGGGNAVDVLEKYYNRIWHLHFKDYDPRIGQMAKENSYDYFTSVAQGVFCELGKGAVDFKSIVDILNNNNYQGWIVVEQDVLPGMGEPKKCAKLNREFLKSLNL